MRRSVIHLNQFPVFLIENMNRTAKSNQQWLKHLKVNLKNQVLLVTQLTKKRKKELSSQLSHLLVLGNRIATLMNQSRVAIVYHKD